VASFALSVAIVSMAVTPNLIGAAIRIADWMLRRHSQHAPDFNDDQTLSTAVASLHRAHVLVCGFGRVGQTVARFLKRAFIPYLALETDMVRIGEARAAGEPIFYGDPCRRDILRLSGIQSAALLVISFDDPAAALRIIAHTRALSHDIPILVRARDDSHLPALLEAGATEVIPETLEASLTLVSHMLVLLGLPLERIERMTDQVRHDRYSLLHGFFPGEKLNLATRRGREAEVVHAVPLPDRASAVGRRMDMLDLDTLAVTVSEVQRENGERIQNPPGDFCLAVGDTLILRGRAGDLEAAEATLLGG
jgi:CPA2 family monovalent cation:H+ antiporter-2